MKGPEGSWYGSFYPFIVVLEGPERTLERRKPACTSACQRNFVELVDCLLSPAGGALYVVVGLGVWDLGFGAWGLGFAVWGLGFRVWGLGFGAWGLGFGAWGFRVLGFGGLGV